MPTFDDLCFTNRIWIVAYVSPTAAAPLYLIWYTDTDEAETDRLLTFQTGEIAAIPALRDLPTVLAKHLDALRPADRLRRWLAELAHHEPVVSATYDLRAVERALQLRRLSGKALEALVSFVNLFGDFVGQDERNSDLALYWRSEPLEEAWYYFYDYFFWPRFRNTTQYQTRSRPAPQFDCGQVADALRQLRQQFEQRLRVVTTGAREA